MRGWGGSVLPLPLWLLESHKSGIILRRIFNGLRMLLRWIAGDRCNSLISGMDSVMQPPHTQANEVIELT